MELKIDQKNLDSLFPFFVAINQNGQVMTFGRSAAKCFKDIQPSKHYSEYFSVIQPKEFDPSAGPEKWTDKISTLRSKSTQMSFNGEIIYVEKSNCLVFAVTPLIQDMDLLSTHHLTYPDFAAYTPIFDFYILSQAEKFARQEQNKAYTSLEELYRYSRLNLEIANICSSSNQFSIASDRTLKLIQDGMGWKGSMVKGTASHPKDQIFAELKSDGQVRYTLIFEDHGTKELNEAKRLFLASLAHTMENLIQRLDREAAVQEAQATKVNSSKMYMLGEMAAGIAHELNNPMAVVQGLAHVTLSGLESPEFSKDKVKESMNKILKMTERSTKIIKGLRIFSRDAKDDPMEMIELGKVVDETLDLCSSRIKSKGIDLKWVSKKEVLLKGRGVQISQVILNLLNNATDAVENLPDPWIEILIESKDQFWKISVTDSGSGVPAEVAEKMMSPFFTTKAPGKGTGLGLSISRSIIQNHGGEFWYDGSSAHTCFCFTLPKIVS